jgi:hypothetical protein
MGRPPALVELQVEFELRQQPTVEQSFTGTWQQLQSPPAASGTADLLTQSFAVRLGH